MGHAGRRPAGTDRQTPRDEFAQHPALGDRHIFHHAPAGQDRLIADDVDVVVAGDLQRQADHLAQHPVAAVVGCPQAGGNLIDTVAQLRQSAFDDRAFVGRQRAQAPNVAIQRSEPIHRAAGGVVVGFREHLRMGIA